jgi:hypothetical protein
MQAYYVDYTKEENSEVNKFRLSLISKSPTPQENSPEVCIWVYNRKSEDAFWLFEHYGLAQCIWDDSFLAILLLEDRDVLLLFQSNWHFSVFTSVHTFQQNIINMRVTTKMPHNKYVKEKYKNTNNENT